MDEYRPYGKVTLCYIDLPSLTSFVDMPNVYCLSQVLSSTEQFWQMVLLLVTLTKVELGHVSRQLPSYEK